MKNKLKPYLNTWLDSTPQWLGGKTEFSLFIDTRISTGAELGILLETKRAWVMREVLWQLRICLLWVRLYIVRYEE